MARYDTSITSWISFHQHCPCQTSRIKLSKLWLYIKPRCALVLWYRSDQWEAELQFIIQRGVNNRWLFKRKQFSTWYKKNIFWMWSEYFLVPRKYSEVSVNIRLNICCLCFQRLTPPLLQKQYLSQGKFEFCEVLVSNIALSKALIGWQESGEWWAMSRCQFLYGSL